MAGTLEQAFTRVGQLLANGYDIAAAEKLSDIGHVTVAEAKEFIRLFRGGSRRTFDTGRAERQRDMLAKVLKSVMSPAIVDIMVEEVK